MIRWDEPIEAVHEDGRVVPMTILSAPARNGTYVTTDAPDNARSNEYWNEDGTDKCICKEWRIRNVATPTPPNTPAGYSDEVVERAVALVRRMTAPGWDASDVDWVAPILAEARAIVVLIEPVDADLAEARKCSAPYIDASDSDILDGGYDSSSQVQAALAAIRRGRALAAEGK